MTVGEAVRQLGPIKGGRVMAFMVAWDLAEQSLGEAWPELFSDQVRAYAEWWRESERSAWREIDRFREALPDEQSPSRIMAAGRERWDARSGARGIASLAVPAT